MDMKELHTKLDTAVSELKSAQAAAISRQDGVISDAVKAAADNLTKIQEQIGAIESKQAAAMRVIEAAENSEAKKTNLLGIAKKNTRWSDERKEAFDSYLRKGDRTKAAEMVAELEAKDITVGNDAQGGFLLPPEMANFISTIAFETSPIRDVARTIQVSRDTIQVPLRDARFGAGKATETSANSKTSTADMALLNIGTAIYEARPLVSQNMLDDADFDVAAFVAEEVANEIGRQENTDYINGNGVNGTPQGLLTLSTWGSSTVYERGKFGGRNSGSNGLTTADSLLRLQGDLKSDYQNNATWLMNRLTYVGALSLKDSYGRYLIGNDLNASIDWANPTLLGRPVKFCSDMPVVDNATANNGAKAVLYGDFKRGYLIVDRTGIRVQVDPYTQKPMVEYFTRKRSGAGVVNFDCIKQLTCS